MDTTSPQLGTVHRTACIRASEPAILPQIVWDILGGSQHHRLERLPEGLSHPLVFPQTTLTQFHSTGWILHKAALCLPIKSTYMMATLSLLHMYEAINHGAAMEQAGESFFSQDNALLVDIHPMMQIAIRKGLVRRVIAVGV